MAIKRGLGKGMMALVDENELEKVDPKETAMVPVNRVIPNRYQPRKEFDQHSLQDLADSIRQKGVLSPILVSELGDGRYELVAGERRLRASKLAGLSEIPALIKDFSEEDRLEIALIENIQREDLNPLEVALAYKEIMEKMNFSQEDLAAKVSKSRAAVANTLRLLKLPDFVQERIARGEISEGHARAVLSLENIDDQIGFTRHIIEQGLSVREAEKLSKEWVGAGPDRTRNVSRETNPRRERVLDELQERFVSSLGARVEISGNIKKGKIQIFYHSEEELENIYRLIKKS